MSMRVLVCGGRGFDNISFIWTSLDKLHAETPFTDFMQGGCPTGVDCMAKEWARTKPGIMRYECKAEWSKYGNAAGPIRNGRMLEWKPDLVVEFPGGRGTADMIRRAEAAGVPVRKYGVDIERAERGRGI